MKRVIFDPTKEVDRNQGNELIDLLKKNNIKYFVKHDLKRESMEEEDKRIISSITEDDEKFILDKLKIIWAYFYDLSDYFENINYITKLKLIHQYSYDKIISLYIEMYKTQPRYIIKIKPYY